jgi:hypothetical protein
MNTYVLDLIKRESIFKLMRYEGGCPCGDCFIGGIHIETHCWRTSINDCNCPASGVHVWAEDELSISYLKEIAKEVLRQMKEIWDYTDWGIVVSK